MEKGEWKARKTVYGYWNIETDEAVICREVRHFNAYLIAKAPQMAELLKDLPLYIGVVYLDDDNPTTPTYTIDKDYIDKAKEITVKEKQ